MPSDREPAPEAPEEPSAHGVVGAVRKDKLRAALFGEQLQTRTIGRYRVVGTVGRGGMGTVLEAVDDRLERRVALKLLHRDLAARDQMRLLREARALARLSHPNVVQVHEVAEQPRPFIAMELVRGQTLGSWQRGRPSVRACVEAYIQAGQGLSAVHEQRLVHRDFKPDNCIIDDGGRVRVMDFGLVRSIDTAASDDTDDQPDDVVPTLDDLEVPLTTTGAVMGTPAYMAPEQLEGGEVDARSDQFSFCVALYEAIHGERPFEGTTPEHLLASIEHGSVRPVPDGVRVPAKLRAVLLRGLVFDPAGRWPSMKALLVELRRVVSPRRALWAAGAVALGLVALGLGLGAAGLAGVIQRCTGAAAQLHGVWGEARKRAVETAFVGTETAYAASTWERLEPRLDAYAEGWADKHHEVCKATRMTQEQSEEQMDLRMACLQDRKMALRSTVRILAEADAQTVQNAIGMVTGLPSLGTCDDVQWLEQQRRATPPPEDPQVAQRVEALRDTLEDVQAERLAGRYPNALERVERVVEDAAPLGYAPLRAEALYQRGRIHEEEARYDQAEHDLERAYVLAAEHGPEDVEVAAAARLTLVVGYPQSRHEQGLWWGITALPLARQRGLEPAAEAMALHNIGVVLHAQSQREEAREHLERALAIREEHLGPGHPEVALSLTELGYLLSSMGQYEQGEQCFRRALAIRREALGSLHPETSRSLKNVANALRDRDELDEALELYQHALDIQAQTLGPEHHEYATTLHGIGDVLRARGQPDEALAHYLRSLAIKEKSLGPSHPWVVDALKAIGSLLGQLERPDEARTYFERALRIAEHAYGPDSLPAATVWEKLGSLLLDYEPAGAVQAYGRALEIRQQHGEGEDFVAVRLLRSLAIAYTRQREFERARPYLETALRVLEGVDDPQYEASLLLMLGEISLEEGEHEQALRHYERALQIWRVEHGEDDFDEGLLKTLMNLSELALVRSEVSTALEHAREAVSLCPQPHSTLECPHAYFVLGQALWRVKGQRDQARRLMQQARDALDVQGISPDVTSHREMFDAWMAEHHVQ